MTHPSPKTDRSLIQRVIVALIFIPILLGMFWMGGLTLFIFLAAVSVVGQWEMFSMLSNRLKTRHRIIGYTGGLSVIISAFMGLAIYSAGIIVAVLMISFFIEMLFGTERKLESIVLCLFVTIYPALFCLFLFKISTFPFKVGFLNGRYVLLYVLITIWMFDTGSYFAGRAWGKRPFFPHISPKKTLEGFIGGCCVVILLSLLMGLYLGKQYIAHVVVLSVLIALAGQAGDLSESVIKRDLGVKDSSHLLPGHGGILDRFDSLFFAGPVVYIYLLTANRISGGLF